MREFVVWWAAIEAVGLAALPLTYAFFARLPDRGYAFCKVVGLLLLGYGLWVGSVAGLFPNSRGSVFFVLFLIAGLSLAVAGRRRRELAGFLRSGWRYVALVEAMFLAVLAASVYIRSFAPDIVWGEKPFELAFLNAVNRSEFFPPEDPWLAGNSISYYYFGYVMIAALTKLVALGTEVTFYLGLSLMAALTWVAAFGLVYNMIVVSRRRSWAPAERLAISPRAAVFGLAGSFLIIIVSNLAGIFELMARHGIGSKGFYDLVGIHDLNGPYDCSAAPSDCSDWFPTPYWWWWKATRMGSPFDIQEFPFFSFQFGDLHPHVLLMPFLIVAFAVAFQVVLVVRGRAVAGAPAEGGAGAWWSGRFWRAWLGAIAVGGGLLAAAVVAGPSLPVVVLLPLIGGSAMWALAALSGGGPADRAELDATWWLRNPAAFIFIALLFGAVAFIDTWGIVISWLLLASVAAVANWLGGAGPLRAVLGTAGFVLPLGVAAYVFYLPFYMELASPVHGLDVTQTAITGGHPPPRSEVTRPLHFLLFWAPAIWVGLSFTTAYLWAARREVLRPSLLAPAALLWAVPVAVWTIVVAMRQGFGGLTDEISERGASTITVAMLAVFITAAGAAFFRELSRRDWQRDPAQLFAFHLAGFVFMMLLGAEFFFVSDLFGWRANTVFRFWHQGWIVMGIVGGYGLYRLTERWRLPDVRLDEVPWQRLAIAALLFGSAYSVLVAADPWNSLYSRWWTATAGLLLAGGSVVALAAFAAVRRASWRLAVPRLAWIGLTAALFAAALVYPLTVMLERTDGFTNAQRMDGLAYKDRREPEEAEAIRWLRENVAGAPVVLEAVDRDFSDAGRVSGRTGLPTVIGWLGHELQWRGYATVTTESGEKTLIEDVPDDVETIYTTMDVELAKELMAKYGVEFVYAGRVERERYGESGLAKFRQFMVPVFENDSVTIFGQPRFRPAVSAPE